jgi:hypothetical protein
VSAKFPSPEVSDCQLTSSSPRSDFTNGNALPQSATGTVDFRPIDVGLRTALVGARLFFTRQLLWFENGW